jgi:hypothetical protein
MKTMTSQFVAIENVVDCWATPIYTAYYGRDAVTDILSRGILLRCTRLPNVSTTNVRSWKSDIDRTLWDDESGATVLHRIREGVNALTTASGYRSDAIAETASDLAVEGWSVVCGDRSYQRLHSHPGARWAGVFFVDADECGDAPGVLEFLDPRHAARPWGLRTFALRPEAGLLVMFPGWLEHWVQPIGGGCKRISLAFNVGQARVA